jgi:trans-aconitate methyltransferase
MTNVPLHKRDWEEMAAVDPLWAILSNPEKRYGKWDIEEFLRTGQEEVCSLMESAELLGLPRQRNRAVDFGCGVGRLTRALQAYFPECHGVDISSRMLEQARTIAPSCQFHLAGNLKELPSEYADLIYSSLVLQHQPDVGQVAALLADMVRVLAPGGLLVFQMPLHLPFRNRLQLRRRAYRMLRAAGISHTFAYERLKLNPIRMLYLSRPEAEKMLNDAGGVILKVEQVRDASGSQSGIYFCTRKSGSFR